VTSTGTFWTAQHEHVAAERTSEQKQASDIMTGALHRVVRRFDQASPTDTICGRRWPAGTLPLQWLDSGSRIREH
jgi:hypothetical protein